MLEKTSTKREWKSYSNPKYKEAEWIEIGGRIGHLLSSEGSPYKIAHISVGDGWDLVKTVRTEVAYKSVEKVLLYLLRTLGDKKQSLFKVSKSFRCVAPPIVDIPEEIVNELLDSVQDETEKWFMDQIKQ